MKNLDSQVFTFEEYLSFFYTHQKQDRYLNRETQISMSMEEIEERYNWHLKILNK